MKPKVVTSYRPHGKWGDFLACTIPMIWCLNILANSNFILRLIEWQTESSLFTVRVRARQWYWIYKFELKTFTDILTAPKNIGHNKWQVNTFGELQTSDDYLHILQLRSQNNWVIKYWGDIVKKAGKGNKQHIVSVQDQFKTSLNKEIRKIFASNYREKLNYQLNAILLNDLALEFPNKFSNHRKKINYSTDINFFYSGNFSTYSSFIHYTPNKNKLVRYVPYPMLEQGRVFRETWERSFFHYFWLVPRRTLTPKPDERTPLNWMAPYHSMFYVSQQKSIYKNIYNSLFIVEPKKLGFTKSFPDLIENSRIIKRTQGVISPVRIIKQPITLLSSKFWEQSSDDLELLNIRFNESNEHLQHKIAPHTHYLVLKQKRYKRKKIIQPRLKFYKTTDGVQTKLLRYSGKAMLADNKIINESLYNPTVQYAMLKKNKLRSDLIPVTLSRRLLRTKKTLVLPAHVNLTLITNSYDIIHSWFIPGLGIKLDCVPGRSTHHTFFIDNVGFYYGQCAEICGRYHHHMPIRICALPFEHFLLWWHTFGLPKLISTPARKRYEQYYVFRKFTW